MGSFTGTPSFMSDTKKSRLSKGKSTTARKYNGLDVIRLISLPDTPAIALM
jgi:hypothetical protein